MAFKYCLTIIVVILTFGCRTERSAVLEPFKPNLSDSSSSVILKETGHAVIEPGIFTMRCVYGEKDSISDHAPIIYGSTATWNITTLVSHRKVFTKKAAFYTHRFRTAKDGTLIDQNQKPIFPTEKSETEGFRGRTPVINAHYAQRLHAIAQKIKKLFVAYQLEHMALQEVPVPHRSDKSGADMREYFARALRPELIYLAPSPKGASARIPDVALVVKPSSKFLVKDADNDLRMQAFCEVDKKLCIVSAHLPFALKISDIEQRCRGIDAFVALLAAQNYHRIVIAGDFNIAAQRLKKVCTAWAVAPSIQTTPGKGASCSNNQGGTSRKSIDLAMEFVIPNVRAR